VKLAVVPCGGLGTRLSGAIGDVPKILAPVADRPLLAHLLESFAEGGIEEVILLAGQGGDRIEAEAKRSPLRVTVVVEPARLGTAGALGLLRDRLPERFLFAFGDVAALVDWRRLAAFDRERGGLGTLVVHRSSHPEDSDRVAVDDDNRVIGFRRRSDRTGLAGSLTNAAVSIFHRELLRWIPRDRACDLTQELLPSLVSARAPLHAYTTSEYVKDMGTPTRLAEVDQAMRSGRARLRAELVLLDRDGVITEPTTRRDELRILPGAAEAVRSLRRAGVKVAVVTNQAAVARGNCSLEELEAIHRRLRAELELDGLYVCVHHPETHHREGVPSLRGPCECRKPSIGMAERALVEQGVPAWRTMVIGDSTVDVQLAHNAELAAALVETGEAGADGRHPAKPCFRFRDLETAARFVTGS
jgi:histidinol-phosphate phosphatase family protein